MTRIPPWVLILAFAVSACGSEAVEGDGNASAAESVPAAASRPAPAPPSGTAPAVQPAAAARPPLQPLSEEDMLSSTQMGCTCTFNSRNSTYLQAIGDELMVRTPAGRQLCPITDVQLQSLGQSDSDVTCAGVQMSISETGARILSPESDSSSAPATLSATGDGVTGTLDGSWGCAC